MPRRQVEIVQMEKAVVYGRGMDSSDRTQADDIPFLSKAFYQHAGYAPGEALPYYIVGSGYNRKKRSFHLFIGGQSDAPALQAFVLPAGAWAKITVKPRFKRLWGGVVGSAKRWFYQSWLPQSEWESGGVEYELHTERSVAEDPEADLYFALRKKGGPAGL